VGSETQRHWSDLARLLCSVVFPVWSPSVDTLRILMGRSQSLQPRGLAHRPPPSKMCLRSSGSICGSRGRFPPHLLILMWFSSPVLRLSASLSLSVLALDMHKVKLRQLRVPYLSSAPPGSGDLCCTIQPLVGRWYPEKGKVIDVSSDSPRHSGEALTADACRLSGSGSFSTVTTVDLISGLTGRIGAQNHAALLL